MREMIGNKFLRKATVSESGCWLWIGANKGNGYGMVRVNGKGMCAHRRAYELFCGPIPARLQVMHLCDNRGCVNPSHLRLGTPQDNTMDACIKERMWSKLTGAQVKEIRQRRKAGEQGKVLAKEFGVAASNISQITRGDTWRYLS